ncbi:hypothetical protein ACFQ9X_18365 [Catenulispora yoronensis]
MAMPWSTFAERYSCPDRVSTTQISECFSPSVPWDSIGADRSVALNAR